MNDDDKFNVGKPTFVDAKSLKVGEVYPLYGVITEILEDTPNKFTAVLNYSIHVTFKDNPRLRDAVKERLFEPGIFKSKILTLAVEPGTSPKIAGSEEGSYHAEVFVEQIIYSTQRAGPDGTKITDTPHYIDEDGIHDFKSKPEVDLMKDSIKKVPNSTINYDKLIEVLADNFTHLRTSILASLEILHKKKNTPNHLLSRVSSYLEIVDKQETLMVELKKAAADNDPVNITKYVQRINAFSQFIKEDAREILSNTKPNMDEIQ